MKLICVDNKGYEKNLSVNKEYEILDMTYMWHDVGDTSNMFRVKCDDGVTRWVDSKRFLNSIEAIALMFGRM